MANSLNSYADHPVVNTLEIYGKSTDEKPIKIYDGFGIANGSTYFEMHTMKLYFYDAENHMWLG